MEYLIKGTLLFLLALMWGSFIYAAMTPWQAAERRFSGKAAFICCWIIGAAMIYILFET